MLIDNSYLEKLEKFMSSGDFKFEFDNGTEERRLELLDFLEKVIEVGELANETATHCIFRDSYMEAARGEKTQK